MNIFIINLSNIISIFGLFLLSYFNLLYFSILSKVTICIYYDLLLVYILLLFVKQF